MFRKLLVAATIVLFATCIGCSGDVSGAPSSADGCVTVQNPSVLDETKSHNEEIPSGTIFIKKVTVDCQNGFVGFSLDIRSKDLTHMNAEIVVRNQGVDYGTTRQINLESDGETQDGWIQLLSLESLKESKEISLRIEVTGLKSNGKPSMLDHRNVEIASKQ